MKGLVVSILLAIAGNSTETTHRMIKIEQANVGVINGHSVGVVDVRGRQLKTTGKTAYTAILSVSAPADGGEQEYLVAQNTEFKIGDQKVRISKVQGADNDNERGYVVFELLKE